MTTDVDRTGPMGRAIGFTLLSGVLGVVLLVAIVIQALAHGGGMIAVSQPPVVVAAIGVGWVSACLVVAATAGTAIRSAWKVEGVGVALAVVLGIVAAIVLTFALLVAAVTLWTVPPAVFDADRKHYPLFEAACRGDTDGVRKHLRAGLSARHRVKVGAQGDALARYLECLGSSAAFNYDLVDSLIAAGSVLTPLDRPYHPPLHAVIDRVRPEDRAAALKYFVQRGASTETRSYSQETALLVAARKQDVDSVRMLVSLGATVDSAQLARIYLEPSVCGTPGAEREPTPAKAQPYLDIVDAVFQAGATVTSDDLDRAGRRCEGQEHLVVHHIKTRYPARVMPR